MTATPTNKPATQSSTASHREVEALARWRRHQWRAKQRGATLAELMTVVTISGILAAVGVNTFNSRVSQVRSVEAVRTLGHIEKGLLAASTEIRVQGGILRPGDQVSGFGGPLGLPSAFAKKDKTPAPAPEPAAGNGNGNDDSALDNDGNNGHGNNDDKCDPSNPNADKKGCGDTADDDDDGGGDSGGDGDDGGGDSGGDGDDSGGDGDDGGGDSGGDGDDGGGDSGGDGSGSGAGTPFSDGTDRLCGSSSAVPEDFENVRGKAYQPSASDWNSGNKSNGWQCLKVSAPTGVQHYQYGYDRGTPRLAVPGSGGLPSGVPEDSTFHVWARGDVDGDGRQSWFVLRGAAVDDRVYVSPAIEIIDGDE